jgi:chaperonin cofactor prefoldin
MKVQKPNDQRSNVKNPNNPQYAADLKNRIRMRQRKLSSMQSKNEILKTEIKSMQKELSKVQNSQKGGTK